MRAFRGVKSLRPALLLNSIVRQASPQAKELKAGCVAKLRRRLSRYRVRWVCGPGWPPARLCFAACLTVDSRTVLPDRGQVAVGPQGAGSLLCAMSRVVSTIVAPRRTRAITEEDVVVLEFPTVSPRTILLDEVLLHDVSAVEDRHGVPVGFELQLRELARTDRRWRVDRPTDRSWRRARIGRGRSSQEQHHSTNQRQGEQALAGRWTLLSFLR